MPVIASITPKRAQSTSAKRATPAIRPSFFSRFVGASIRDPHAGQPIQPTGRSVPPPNQVIVRIRQKNIPLGIDGNPFAQRFHHPPAGEFFQPVAEHKEMGELARERRPLEMTVKQAVHAAGRNPVEVGGVCRLEGGHAVQGGVAPVAETVEKEEDTAHGISLEMLPAAFSAGATVCWLIMGASRRIPSARSNFIATLPPNQMDNSNRALLP